MTWNDRWETKLFLGGQGTARWNGTETVTAFHVIQFTLFDAI